MNNLNESKLIFVCATRMNLSDFMIKSQLAVSLRRVGEFTPLKLKVFCENNIPLPKLYNIVIEEASDNELLIFVHDDVYIDDWMFGLRIIQALKKYDLIGVAGNKRNQKNQLTWYLTPDCKSFDKESICGAIAHGVAADSSISVYGPADKDVSLLDGVMLAANAKSLIKSKIRFDSDFAFHFYDLDFTSACIMSGLRVGVINLALTHESKGASIFSESWSTTSVFYKNKYF